MIRSPSSEPPPLWVVSELYYPEETSTGYILTKIAEGLAVGRNVRVVCGQPTYSSRGVRAPARERRKGVEIERCWGTTWNKDILPLRLVNLLTISCSIFVRLLCDLRSGERVLVVTNPPLLPFVVALACRLRRARCLLLIHDVYPEVAVAAGLLRSESPVARLLNNCVRRLYASVENIIVLGRDMKSLAQAKLTDGQDRVVVIPNWADLELVRPEARSSNPLSNELGLLDRFVLQYAGNMGQSHNIEGVLECATLLASDPAFHFLVIGSGAKRRWLKRAVNDRCLNNITLLDHRPRSQSQDFLNACDVAIITMVAGMAGVSVPSRLYNVLATGKPIIAVADPNSELALVVSEEQIGWVVPPNNAEALANAVREAASDQPRLEQMGRRARRAAETKYSLERVIRAYADLLADLSGPVETEATGPQLKRAA